MDSPAAALSTLIAVMLSFVGVYAKTVHDAVYDRFVLETPITLETKTWGSRDALRAVMRQQQFVSYAIGVEFPDVPITIGFHNKPLGQALRSLLDPIGCRLETEAGVFIFVRR